jgi:hypothetical protein
MCNTDIFEGWIFNAFKGVKVCPVLGTSNTGEKEVQVKALSRSGVSMVHPAYGKAFLPPGPSRVVLVLMPYYSRGIILVEKIKDFTALWLLSIGFKPSSKYGVPLCIGINNLLQIINSIRIKDNSVLVFKMDLKVHNTRDLLLHVEEVEMLQSLTAANIAC